MIPQFHIRPDQPSDVLVVKEIWEEDVYRVNDLLSSAQFVIDLGANIGVFTRLVLERSQAFVLAIEPESHNYALALDNLADMPSERYKLSRVAVSDYNGNSTINDGAGGSRLEQSGPEVMVQRLDDLLKELGLTQPIDIIKMDIEDAEWPVILDMSPELLERTKYLTIEFGNHNGHLGEAVFRTTTSWVGDVVWATGGKLGVRVLQWSGTVDVKHANVTATVPFTWANTHTFFLTAEYEAA